MEGERLSLGLAALLVGVLAGAGACDSDAGVTPRLVGSWTVAEFGGSGGRMTPFWEPRAVVEFTSDGQISGDTGCNRFDGRFEVAEGQLELRFVTITLSGCPNDAMLAQESSFLRLFEGSPMVILDGERATLWVEGTNAVIVLLRASKLVGSRSTGD